MPRLDFEKQFARQLKDRELKPSAGSWERLQGKLEKEEKKHPQYWWIGIAATIVGAILIFNFVQTDPVTDAAPVIVDTDPEKIEIPIKDKEVPGIEVSMEDKNNPGKAEEGSLHTAVSHEETSTPENTGIIAEADDEVAKAPEKGQYTEDFSLSGLADNNSTLALEEVAGETEISDSEINALLQAALAEVSEEDPGSFEVTEEQINALLAEARAEVRKERVLYQTASVSAEDLLLEVETELEDSFREQVFELIKDGLRKTRTAVANRNN